MTPSRPPVMDRPEAVSSLIEINAVGAGESPDERAEKILAGWSDDPSPDLLSVACFASDDDEVITTISQWRTDGDGEVLRPDLPGEPARLRFRLYRSGPVDPGRTAGCFNIVIRVSPGPERAREFVDALLERSSSLAELNQPITGSFHLGLDGKCTLLYSEWETKAEHDAHRETMRHTMADLYEGLPAPLSVRQYRHYRSLHIA
ncbi:hypothetical protein [Amycolatopsis sp. NPDC051071]|uniref:antibiotic biosynthesis monooxygenase n=1 Tax=Amycolatopsis sp. NPDC051071 TaxID=3154637 RepID=UPI0034269C97